MLQLGKAGLGINSQSRNPTGIWGVQPRRKQARRRRNVHQPWRTLLFWEEG